VSKFYRSREQRVETFRLESVRQPVPPYTIH